MADVRECHRRQTQAMFFKFLALLFVRFEIWVFCASRIAGVMLDGIRGNHLVAEHLRQFVQRQELHGHLQLDEAVYM